LMRPFLLMVVLSLNALPARAGMNSLVHALGPLIVGIPGGREAKRDDFRSTVMIQLKLPDGKVKTCTGFVVEGCVVTAAHCASLLAGSQHEILEGQTPKKATSGVTDLKMWGDGTLPEKDLAVLKPYFPPQASFGNSRDDIATRMPEGRPLMHVVGYGLSGTAPGPNGTRHNIGLGTKRWGQVKVDHFSTDGSDELADGPLIASIPATQKIAPGDSGGYLVKDGIIYGVATVVKPEYALRPGEKPPEGDLLVDDILYSYHVNLTKPEARKFVMDSLDGLGCRTNTQEAVMLAVRDIVQGRDGFSKIFWKTDWEKRGKPEQAVVDKLKLEIKRLLNLPPETGFAIAPINYGNNEFDFEYTVGPIDKPTKLGHFGVELDTGKVVFKDEKNVVVRQLAPGFEDGNRSPTDPPQTRILIEP